MKCRVLESLGKNGIGIGVPGHHCVVRVYRLRCARSPMRGAGMTQLAVECVEIPDGLLLALDECLEEVRFVERKESALIVTVLTCFSSASVFSSVRLMASW